VKLRRLLPEPGEIDVVEAAAGLAGRETFAVNMVASADGRAALEGRTAPLSDPADRELFHTLRAQADAVLVGTGTLRAEGYGPFTKNERLRELRAGLGLAPAPLGIVMTRTMDLPYQAPLFQDAGSRIAVYTSAGAGAQPCPATLEVHHLDVLDPRAVVAHVRETYGVRCILGEGGPHINAPLFAAGVVDELFLTVSPTLAGGHDVLTIIEGDLPAPLALELRQALVHEGTLLLRYRVAG
jgi:riboflavin biosynthesis pyrimidine reductase